MSFGDFLTSALAVGAGFMIGGPLGGALAGGLIGGAREGSGGIGRGAALGALGAVIGAGFSEAGLFEGAGTADASTLGTEAATAETLTTGGSTAALGAPEAATTTEQLAQGTLAGETAGTEAGVFSPSGGSAGVGEGGTITGEMVGGGVSGGGTSVIPAGEGGGLINSVLNFTKQPLASIMGFGAVKGIAERDAMKEKAERERQAALDLLEAKRRQAPSTGGVGVNLGIRPGDPILRRPGTGEPVFRPGGLIASNMRR